MNIVILTPALRTSAIGRMAALVVRQLRLQGHVVDVVRAEAAVLHSKKAHDFGVELIAWTDVPAVRAVIDAADLVVHQVGNNYDYHEGNLYWLDQAPGVVCLHDFYLAHLFHGWAVSRIEQARGVLDRWYGAGASDDFFRHASDVRFIELTCDRMPMTEWVAAKASAVIAHSSWGVDRVLDACAGPVWTVPLAYDIPEDDSPAADTESGRDDITLLTVGHVNLNKRAENVVRAIGGSELLRTRIVYRLVGRIEPAMLMSLTELARNMEVRLVVSGEVDDELLTDAFHRADLVSCLRWPSLESASASAIEAMLHGKPVLVTDTAFYSELPDDCVMKIAMADEEASIRKALEDFCHAPEAAKAMGDRARQWAQATFSPSHYARRLVDLALPVHRAAWLAKAVLPAARHLAAWGGSSRWLASPSVIAPLNGIVADYESPD